MATYVVGDIQGCFNTFQSLLMRIKFNSLQDRLIVLGDVVNRGSKSLEILRYLKQNEDHISMVLGNHEIFAIALMLGAISPPSPATHTLEELLKAPDAPELLAWLRCRPFIIKEDNSLFVHAGLLPAWSIEQALDWASALQNKLKSTHAHNFLKEYFTAPLKPEICDLRLALASLTRIRMCASKNIIDLSYAGTLAQAPLGLKPWFMMRTDPKFFIYFGHWAALGFYNYKNYYCLDSGCGWGRKLSALRLEDHMLFQQDNCD